VDLGARFSIINRQTFNDLQLSQLDKPDAVLRAYGGRIIKCMGVVQVSDELNGHVKPCFKFFVSIEGPLIMAVDLFDALGDVTRE